MKSLALGALVVTCVFQPASAQNLPPRRPAHAVRTTAMRIAPLSGSSPRTFVSSAGMDTNPCSRSAPCRSFGAAIAQTAAGGEVIVLDSAGYGAATIGSSISLIAPRGVYAGVSVPGGAGITISAAATDVVTLRGLTLNGTGGGDGIYLASGGVLYLQQLTIQNFSDYRRLANRGHDRDSIGHHWCVPWQPNDGRDRPMYDRRLTLRGRFQRCRRVVRSLRSCAEMRCHRQLRDWFLCRGGRSQRRRLIYQPQRLWPVFVFDGTCSENFHRQ